MEYPLSDRLSNTSTRGGTFRIFAGRWNCPSDSKCRDPGDFSNYDKKWFDDSARVWNRKSLFDAVWSGNTEVMTEEMNKLLRRTISYHDYKEDYYHAFLAGILQVQGTLWNPTRSTEKEEAMW